MAERPPRALFGRSDVHIGDPIRGRFRGQAVSLTGLQVPCTHGNPLCARAHGLSTRQESVTDSIRTLVMTNVFAPGEHLFEVALADRLGVSRTPVRSALTALAQEGLLVYRPQRGYVVREFSLKDVVDAYRVRAHLEGLACRLLAEAGMSPEVERSLTGTLAEGDAILSCGMLREEDNAPWRAMNNTFHQTILAASGNASLIDVTQRTLAFPFASARVVHWYDYEAIRFSHLLHHAMFKAIRRQEGERAEVLMREHIWAATEVIAKRLDEIRGSGAHG